MTFNEINCVKHHPFVSVGVIEENHPHLEQAKYQGAHHQFIASACLLYTSDAADD